MLRKYRLILSAFRNYSKLTKKQIIKPEYIDELPVYDYVSAGCDRNRVYVWGNYLTGALGSPRGKKKENVQQIEFFRCPRRLFFAEKTDVRNVAAGFGFTLFATKKKVFGCGLNMDSQIGYHEMRRDHPLEILFAPMEIALPFTENETVLKISAGRAHSAVLTDQGLYLFGNNAYGQCGRTVIDGESYNGSKFVNKLDLLGGKRIVDVTCGQDHSLAINEDGEVYGCGWGADGQTGLGHYNCVANFTKLNGDIAGENVKKISCRCDFSLAINDKNEVFGWGNTEYSQLNDANRSQQECNPRYIGNLSNVIDVATGGSYCAALTDEGNVLVWGFGILGLGPNVQETKVPTLIPPPLFGRNDFNPSTKVISIHSGLGHLGAVTSDGNLYIWGRNRSCCLGIDTDKDQFFPYKVSMAAQVGQVACGLDHTLAICKSFISENKTKVT